MNKTLEQVVQYLRDAIANHPIKEEGKGYLPEVYYQNGNDGTDFDWSCNDCTCEFFVFYNTGEHALGYVKAQVTKQGFITGYVWDTERYGNGVRLPDVPLAEDAIGRDQYNAYYMPTWTRETMAARRAQRFRNWLMKTRDKMHIYDEPIATL